MGGRRAALVVAFTTLAACGSGAPSSPSARRPPTSGSPSPLDVSSPGAASASSPGASASAVPRPTVASAPLGGWESVAVFPPLVSPALAPVFERWRSELDTAHWFVSHPESMPKGFRPWPSSRRGPFPGAQEPHKVVAHRFALDRQKPGAALLDGWVSGCGGGLVDARGARCPSVSYPGRELTPAQSAELLAIANTPNDVPRTIMNSYSARFGFVFFDADQRPFAQALVNASVDKLVLSPGTGTEIDTMMPARRARLRTLLTELELLEPDVPELDALLSEQQRQDGELFRLRFLPPSAGVPADVRLAALSDAQKLRLCYWHASSGFVTSGRGLECDDGLRMVGQDMQQCVSTFPACDLTVGEAEDCMRRQRVDHCYERRESRRCGEQRECLWGMVELPAAGGCDAAKHRFTVAVTARSPAARARLLQGVRSEPPRCQGSTIYYEFTGMELLAMFGRHLALQGVAGAGNSMQTCGWFDQLTPADFVPPPFFPDAKGVEIVADVKFELYSQLKACK